MNIPALLDLDQAIKQFQQLVQPLLELSDFSAWDANTLRERESAVRNLGLVLAGQCIALLLQKLSLDPQAEAQAQQRTLTSRGFGSRHQGKRTVKILSVGNVEVPLSVSYILSRPNERKKKS